jgi:N-methylhydantoinase A
VSAGIYRLAADIGGTFTDIVLEATSDGTVTKRWTAKVLTTSRAPEEGVMQGIERILAETSVKHADVGVFVHGTTLATNAIIERKGARTALIATEGFRDVLDIADEGRYDQYDIYIAKPAPLVPRSLRFTVPERIDVHGAERLPFDADAARALVPALQAARVESVGVAFLHSYANPAHERQMRDILQQALPGVAVTLSSDVCPEVREYERTSTTVANAYVQPLMAGYLGRLGDALAANGFRGVFYMITSGGGLTSLETARRFPIRLVESGPAGGAILAAHVAAECGEPNVLSFDMGGTTAKICLIEKYAPFKSRHFEVDRAARFLKGSGLPLRIPVIEMVEIGAGGGSIARVDELKRIVVGPDSAGSEPGPACYGRGGTEPTVTDADVVTGRIDPARFAGGTLKLEVDAAAKALAAAVGAKLSLSGDMAAYGVGEIVDENMANAARVHAVERGAIVGDRTLVAFGGAAPLHAARLAEKLGIARVIVPPNAGVGSAIGFLQAPIAYELVRSRHMIVQKFDPAVANAILGEMSVEANEVVRAGAQGAPVRETRQAFMRYVGQGHEIVVEMPVRALTAGDGTVLREAFEREYAQLFSRIIPGATIEIITWSVIVSTERKLPDPVGAVARKPAAKAVGERAVLDGRTGTRRTVPVYWRPDLTPGMSLAGPAIIAEDETSTFVASSFDAHIDAAHCIVLERRSADVSSAGSAGVPPAS